MISDYRKSLGALLATGIVFISGCNTANKSGDSGLTAADARAIAKEAYIYGFPMAANYQTMYKQAIDTTGKDYRGAFNTLNSSSRWRRLRTSSW